MAAEKPETDNHDTIEALNDSALRHAAERGQAATDKYGQSVGTTVSFR